MKPIRQSRSTKSRLAFYTRLERRRRRRPSPATPGYFLPTRIGNILRAAERRPLDKYGLDTAAATTLWALLFTTFTPFTWLALPAGLAVAALTVTWVILARAHTFGELIEPAYDTHRTALSTQLRWPPPETPAEEKAAGQALTAYLWRGSDHTTPTFTPPP